MGQQWLDTLYSLAAKDLIAFKVYLALLKKIRTNNNLKVYFKVEKMAEELNLDSSVFTAALKFLDKDEYLDINYAKGYLFINRELVLGISWRKKQKKHTEKIEEDFTPWARAIDAVNSAETHEELVAAAVALRNLQ